MSVNFRIQHNVHPEDFKGYDTQTLRDRFLVSDLFVANQVELVYSMIDRFIVGGIMPTTETVALESFELLKSPDFLTRREAGFINIGGAGVITADGERYELDCRDALYLGAGNQTVTFESVDVARPARFYFNSATAHRSCPNRHVRFEDAVAVELGNGTSANERRINKLLVSDVVETCQLQMGLTEFKPGSVWNTMPVHLHSRRNEAYFYFDLPDEQAICHFMGEPTDTRHLWLGNCQGVISPSWSIHSGVGTANYAFIWGMAGENLDYDDMEKFTPDQLR